MKNKYLLLLFSAVLFIAAYFLYKPYLVGVQSTVADFETVLHKKEARLNTEMIALAKRADTLNYNQLFTEKPVYYNSLFEEEGIVMLIYENDTLNYWSDNSIAVENWRREVCLDTRMVKLHNGWFEVMRPPTSSYTAKTVVGLILLKNEYPYENKYLVNQFQNDFTLPVGTKLTLNNGEDANQVKSFSQEYLFSLVFSTINNSLSLPSYFALCFNLLAFFLLLLFIKKESFSLANVVGVNASLLLFIVAVMALRFISIKFSFPSIFYEFDLFSPQVYADASSVWLNSLGDLLINTFLLFYICYFIIKEFDTDTFLTKVKSINPVLVSFLCFIALFGFLGMTSSVFMGLIKNSNIPYSINKLFSLNQFSYISLSVIALLLFICFLFADKIVKLQKKMQLSTKQYVVAFIIAASIHTSIWHALGVFDLIIVFWPFLLVLLIALIKKRHTVYPFSGIVALVSVFALFAVHVLIKHTGIREVESRKIYVKKLTAEQDPVTEFLFQDIEKRVQQDSILSDYIHGGGKELDKFEKRLKQKYFVGFWDKYDIKIALFDSMCVPMTTAKNTTVDNTIYFDRLVADKGVPTASENLTFLKNTSGKVSYLAKFPLNHSSETHAKHGSFYIELDAKFISDEIGFPELLLDKNIGLSQELSNYSYAKYKNGKLINQFGDYPYSAIANDFEGFANNSLIEKENFDHLLFQPDAATLIVLSNKKEGLIDRLATFSYLFAFFSLLLLAILFIRQIISGALFDNFNFKYRIQLLLVFIVLISLALFGGGTIYYIQKQFEAKNRENIREKIQSVLIDIDGKLSGEESLDKSISDYSTFLLKKLSTIFFTDINLYDTDGNLFASSRPKVFDEGLTSKKMNAEAFSQMHVLGKKEFVHDERIGKLEYLSAYHSFKNKDGKILAYLNLPHFAKQSELEKEISGILVALINIYVLLFALTILMAIVISNYVTKPLKLIQDKLSKIELGTTNELIDWKDNDEIGSLVSEYNRMILELSKSADLLVKSERESAWREMAKQVAHEIKNPLTPMKLSVQHLQRIWKDRALDMDEKMERLTQTIIEQIDTLSTIATEFSNFAKMPKANVDKVNIHDTLLNSISLFSDTENVQIDFDKYTENEPFVLADKEQLLRVFNNLIKNAIQAIPDGKKGAINISLKKKSDAYIIAVADNGTGIAKDLSDKIFAPNFTTKTGGSGLGLAMVKSMVEGFEGEIWFENNVPEGCTFHVSIPCYSLA